MEDKLIFLYLLLILLLALSAFFSSTKTAYTDSSENKLKYFEDQGKRRASIALENLNNADTLISTTIIGDVIANIGIASITAMICIHYWGNIGIVISIVIATVIVLMVGEMSPIAIAGERPEKFAISSARLIRPFIFIFRPLSFLFAKWKKLTIKLFNIGENDSISEEDLLDIVGEAREYGGININEETMIRQAIEFDDLKTSDIFTARVDVVGIDINADKEEVTETFYSSGFSRLPVYDESLDNISGILLLKDYFYNLQLGNDKISAIMRPPVFVPESIKISQLLIKLQENNSHIAIAVDEFGGTLGIVTMEDIIEELIGDIWDEYDEIVDEIETVGINKYRVIGSTELPSFKELMDIDYDFESLHSNTVGGWICEELGRFPDENEEIEIAGIKILVSKVGKNRIEEIIAQKV